MLNSLNVAQSGLRAAQTSVENVMNNIANENTAGYKKRTVNLLELQHNDSRIVGRGVSVAGVDRATSNYMFNNLIDEGTKENYYTELSGMLSGVESLFKETDKSGFSADLNRYFQSIENLRSNPGSTVYKNDVKTQGTVIVDSLTRLYNGVEKQEEMAKESLEDDIKTINGILQDIGKINEQLGQEVEASNDLLDRRDQLEVELSKYVDIEVNRTSDDYELKIGGSTAVRHSTNIREVTLDEEFIPQVDRYINDDGKTSSILNGVNFDDGDVINFKLDNNSSVSVTFGEVMTFDINNDGTVDANDTVNGDNVVRALVNKINNSTDMLGKVEAFNGSYALDADGNKVTLDNVDNFLYIESKIPGTDGDFDSRISFVESSNPVVTPPVGTPSVSSITSSTKNEGNPLLHNVSLSNASANDETFTFTIADGTTSGALDYTVSGMTFTNGVTYNAATNEITVPAGVTDFSVSVPTVNDGTGGTGTELSDESFTLSIGTSGAMQTATGTIRDTGQTAVLSSVSSEASPEGDALVHTIDLSNTISTSGAVGVDFTFSLTDITTESGIDTNNITFSNGVTLSGNTLHIPDGVSNFTATINSVEDTFHETDETYQLSITDTSANTLNATGTIENDDTAVSYAIYKNDEQSTKGEDKAGLSVYDKIIPISSGSTKAQIDNLNSANPNNVFQKYKDQLDAFANTLADMTDQYMRNGDDDYIYGESAIDDISHKDGSLIDNNIFNLGLFSGSSVKTLQFNSLAVNDLDQNDLDYLATMQFKKDIYFNGRPQGSTLTGYEDSGKTTFSDYFQSVRVGVSADKENTDFLKDTQMTVKQSIQNTYDQITKVDRDEEMLALIKFQAAYTANAKVVTVVDEMLNTLLGLKR